jgi:hypothetical protein
MKNKTEKTNVKVALTLATAALLGTSNLAQANKASTAGA